MLFHYCSSETFLSIVESRELWASDLSKMNDPDEVKRGAEIIRDLLDRLAPELGRALGSTNLIYLACSFSKNGDLLSQWRAYGDDGNGFSVGVDREALTIANGDPQPGAERKDGLRNGAPGFRISDVFYSEKEFTGHYVSLINHYMAQQEHSKEEPEELRRLRELQLIRELAEASCLIKSDFYEDECEARLFNAISPEEAKSLSQSPEVRERVDVRFRAARFGIKPYAPVRLVGNDTSSLRKIVIGPNNESSIDDVKLVLKLNGFDDVEVVKSKGKYR